MRFTIRASKYWRSVSRTGEILALGVFLCLLPAAEAQVTIDGTMAATTLRPFASAVDIERNVLYVSSFLDYTVEIYDLDTRNKISVVPVGPTPRTPVLSTDGGRLIVPHLIGASAAVIDTDTRTVVGTAVTSSFSAVALVTPAAPGTSWLLSAGTTPTNLLSIDLTDASSPGALSLPQTELNIQPAVTPDGSTAIIPISIIYPSASNDLLFVDLAGLTIDGSVAVGHRPRKVIVSNDGTTAYVVNEGSSDAHVVDIAGRTVLSSFATAQSPSNLALFDDDRRLAVIGPGSFTIQLFDVRDPGNPVHEFDIPVAGLFQGEPGSSVLALDYAGLLLVTGPLTDEVYVIDIDPVSGTYGSLLQTLSVPSFPTDLDAGPERGQAWVTSYLAGTITVLTIPQLSIGLSGAIDTAVADLQDLLDDPAIGGGAGVQIDRAINWLEGADGLGGALAALENGDLDAALQMLAQAISALETAARHGAPVDDIVIALAESAALEAHAYVDAVAETVSPSNRQIQKARRALERGDAWLAAGRAHTAISSYRQAVIAAERAA